jgi:hypothetical protein
MQIYLAYTFNSDQVANRFLNDVRSGTIAGVSARFYSDSKTVKLSYKVLENGGNFDGRTAALDDMAVYYEGSEVPV